MEPTSVCNSETQDFCAFLTVKPVNWNMEEDVLSSSCEMVDGRLSADKLGLDTLNFSDEIGHA
jgi:hypothetical protein